jgi:mono/diheme cytochrome c family protein
MRHRSVRTVRNIVTTSAAIAVLVLGAMRGVQSSATTDPAVHEADRVARGQYLVTIGGCNDCHTPWKVGENGPEPDMSRMLSGHPETVRMPPAPEAEGEWLVSMAATNTAFAGPWGVSFAANLTPDEHTGLGAWNEEIFINTLRRGRHWGQSRPLLPPMPWFNYGRMSDEDLKSVFAYLRSIPPRRNAVPLPIPPGGRDETEEDPWN